MPKQKEAQTILVTGDVTIDWNIACEQRVDSANANIWDVNVFSEAFGHVVGSCLIADLVQEIASKLNKNNKQQFEIKRPVVRKEDLKPDNNSLNHSYAIWSPFEYDNSEAGKKRKVWRLREYLGVSRASVGIPRKSGDLFSDEKNLKPSIIILDDSGYGFRDNEMLWPDVLFQSPGTQIILKIASPVTNSKLLDRLLDECPQKLTVITTADDLRRSHIDISKGISWERTTQELLWEFAYNPVLNRFSHCANIVISFLTSGAILLSTKDQKAGKRDKGMDASLFFDPDSNEDRWGQKYRGGVIGYTSCLTAAIAREFMIDAKKPDVSFAIQSGVNAMRLLKADGYGDADKTGPEFPITKVAAKFEESVSPLAVADFTVFDAKKSHPLTFHTILEDRYKDDMEKVAKDIVRKGLEKVISGVPLCRFGKLTSIDRREIEALNNIHSLINEYFQGNQSKPVSIAVFGPPGSGKSFSITQMAESIAKDQMKAITFNISQFTGVKDLIDAFHQVRDISLTGKLPLVFWDEFDTTLDGVELGWLRYFLAPMQDGTFQDGQIIHPIGRSVFVFAGGTSTTMEEFGKNLDEVKRKQAKLIDFVSRLKGFLNVIGVNPAGNERDRCYIIRRAITLRSILERSANQVISSTGRDKMADIDEAVINAFLLTEKYKHGIRSMESIVAMSNLSNKTSFEKSYLPDESQLEMHVDVNDFVSILQRLVLDPVIIEKMAVEMHEIYCKTLSKEGYKYGKPSNDSAKKNENLVPYHKLSDGMKEQNCELAHDIPHKLSLKGYVLLAASSGKACNEFTIGEIESLAKNEHERWMREKLAKGYTYGNDRDRMQNPFLLEWSKLTNALKERDRALVRGIPEILTKYGYTMVKKDKLESEQ
jgi:hypothetical protein